MTLWVASGGQRVGMFYEVRGEFANEVTQDKLHRGLDRLIVQVEHEIRKRDGDAR